MAEKTLDCRGLACPAPVIQTKAILDQGGIDRLSVWVDNEAARENVCRLLTHAGFLVRVEETAAGIRIIGEAATAQTASEVAQPAATPAGLKIMVMVATDRLGQGDDFLGERLLLNFLDTLKEMGPELWTLVFLNAGVKLACVGSAALPELQSLAAKGVKILVCGTCLQHFQLLEKKQVGDTTNMLDIVTHLQVADKVITLT